MKQKANEQQIVTINDYVNNYESAHDLHYPPDSPEYNELKSQMAPAYESAFSAAAGDHFSTLMTYFMKVFPPPAPNDYTNTQDYFLLIPHSQGNLYANAMFVALTSTYHMNTNRIAIYGIASPANSNKGDWIARIAQQFLMKNVTSYTTSANDLVIGGLNSLHSTLPANIYIPTSSTDLLGHNLISVYLLDKNSLTQISKMIDLDSFALLYLTDLTFNPKNNYYKFKIWMGPYQNTSILVGPDNSILCSNGDCDADFDFYIMQDHPAIPEPDIFDGKLFFLPIKKFKPGTYTTAIDETPPGGLVVYLAESVNVSEITYDHNTHTCSFVEPYSHNFLVTILGVPWDEVQKYCPQYFTHGDFISEQAEIN
jgi:hypothetical protein